jgi:DNA-binding Lrp family transcriptional regulator
MEERIDGTDMSILKELRKDCKQPLKALAGKLKIHPNTLMQRVKRLEKLKVIRGYQADIDYEKLGYDMHAIAMIKIRRRGLEKKALLEHVLGLPELEGLYAVTGAADCMAVVKAKGRNDLLRVLKEVQSDEDVLRTTTYLVLDTYKDSRRFNPIK